MGCSCDKTSPLEQLNHAFCIARLLGTKGGGFVSKFTLFSCVYPSVNPKVVEGGPIGHKTGLSLPLSRL